MVGNFNMKEARCDTEEGVPRLTILNYYSKIASCFQQISRFFSRFSWGAYPQIPYVLHVQVRYTPCNNISVSTSTLFGTSYIATHLLIIIIMIACFVRELYTETAAARTVV